ncbi:hypothetical protein Nepgr_022466 [Nepenthes gracilis]|uniref:Uncharacterized protein n=1 Tax=Nepenthes gracilis TaxID=150966 RepID=A0AAD3XY79_NEPGR|nr:hypothetical protein Nepgr_022466 [Nepenthes gracilis]
MSPILVLWMDACETKEELYSNTKKAMNTLKPPLVPPKEQWSYHTRSRTREIGSRYMSLAPKNTVCFRRSQSPKLSRTCNSSSQLTPKRAISQSGGDLPPYLSRIAHLHGSRSISRAAIVIQKIASGGRSPESYGLPPCVVLVFHFNRCHFNSKSKRRKNQLVMPFRSHFEAFLKGGTKQAGKHHRSTKAYTRERGAL